MTAPGQDVSRLVFWQGAPSIHQNALLEALAREIPVTLVTEVQISQRRLETGWTSPDYRGVEHLHTPSQEERSLLLAGFDGSEVHIFSGLGHNPKNDSCFRSLSLIGATLGSYSESYDTRGLRGPLRLMRARARTRDLSPFLSFSLAVGKSAVTQQARLNKSNAPIYEFGYFIEPLGEEKIAAVRPNACIRIGFVGSMERHKNPELLLRALAKNLDLEWTAEFIGQGPLRRRLQNFSERLGFADRLSMVPVVENDSLRERLLGYDVLVLPSRYDGWGVVVNEILHSGGRALVSPRAGVSALAVSNLQVSTFRYDSQSLATSLRQVILQGPVSIQERREFSKGADDAIGATRAAAYLLEIARLRKSGLASRVTPPWL